MDIVKREVMLSLNCHGIASVKSFDSERQTIVATMAYSKTYYRRNEKGLYSPKTVAYPILMDCPMIVLGGGGGRVTFPVGAGDNCLILFNDRDLDNWFAGATSGPVATPRAHSFSDAIALVGLNQIPIEDYDTERARFEYNGAFVAVGKTGKVLVGNATQNLRDTLQDLMTAISSLNTLLGTAFGTNAVNGSPLYAGWAAGLSPVTTALNAVNTQIGALLE